MNLFTYLHAELELNRRNCTRVRHESQECDPKSAVSLNTKTAYNLVENLQ